MSELRRPRIGEKLSIRTYAFSRAGPRKKWPFGQLSANVCRQARANPSWRSWRLRAKSFFESVDDTSDAIFDQGNVEVNEQPQAFVCQFQIGEKLLLVHWRDALQRFDLHDHGVLHNQVGEKACMDSNGVIDHRDSLLAGDA